MADELSLLDLWGSPFCVRVRIALREKGLQFKSIEEDHNNKSPLLLEMNPVHKQILVFIHSGKPVSESTITVQYIDATPSQIYRVVRRVCVETGKEQEAAKKELMECFKLLERELGDKAYFGGNAFGIVDVNLIPFYTWFYGIEILRNLSLKEELVKMTWWAERCMERESVRKSVPDEGKFYREVLLLIKAKYDDSRRRHS